MKGKRGKAPCGHDGEAIFGQYYKCLSGCDDKKKPTPLPDDWDTITLETTKCIFCASLNVDEDFQVDPWYYVFNPTAPILDTRCFDCGKCWVR